MGDEVCVCGVDMKKTAATTDECWTGLDCTRAIGLREPHTRQTRHLLSRPSHQPSYTQCMVIPAEKPGAPTQPMLVSSVHSLLYCINLAPTVPSLSRSYTEAEVAVNVACACLLWSPRTALILGCRHHTPIIPLHYLRVCWAIKTA